MASRLHEAIPLSTKMAVIDAVEKGTEYKYEVPASFGLPKSTVNAILKNKAKLQIISRVIGK